MELRVNGRFSVMKDSMRIEEIASKSSGLIKSLYEQALSVNLPYPEFALATALHTVSGISARAFKWPTSTAPTFYSFIVGEPGAGKNGYLKMLESYLCAVGEKYTIGRLVSRTGTVAELSRWPCRTLIEDEIGNSWLETYAPKASEARREIQDLLLTLHGENKSLAGTANKKVEDQVKRVFWPRLSVFGATTRTAMHDLTQTKPFERSGMISRLLVWETEKTVLPKGPPTGWELDPAILDGLRRIARHGVVGLNVDEGEEAMKPEATTSVRLSGAADASLLTWLRASSEKREALCAEESEAFGQVYSRATDNAYRFAYAHCAGRESLEVSEQDAAFGVALASLHLSRTLERMGRQSEEQRLMDMLLDWLQGTGSVSVRMVARTGPNQIRRLASHGIRGMLNELVASGYVKCLKDEHSETFSATGGRLASLSAATLAKKKKHI